MTNGERKALLFLAGLGALGGVARVVSNPSHTPSRAERLALATQVAAVDSARRSSARTPRTRGRVARAPQGPSAPSAATPIATVDLDVADEAAIEALPGIGPALARRIVEDRVTRGTFGSLDGLRQVRGVGAKLAARVAPYVTFSGAPRPPSAAVARPP